MAFQLIVDHRVAQKVATLEDAVLAAGVCLQKPKRPCIAIVDLSGKIYRDDQVIRLVESLAWLERGSKGRVN